MELHDRILAGDALEVLRTLPSESVQCVVTSPPYFGLRDYGVPGQLGLEPSPDEYLTRMVAVFAEVRRVLRSDGTCWVNMGDSYANDGKWGGHTGGKHAYGLHGMPIGRNKRYSALKPKDLCMMPARLALALQQPYYTGRIKDEKDRVWLAAMIDGEGCMFIHKRKVGQSNGNGYERKHASFGAGLEVANTNSAVLERCKAITGIGSICRQDKDRRQPLYRWNVRSNECRDIIREVYPYLVAKQHQARLLLGCPSSGAQADAAHEAMILLHNGQETSVDFPPPASLYEPGWYLRAEVVWAKKNPMPESVTDRPTRSHEMIYLLTKSERYYYDSEAIREPVTGGSHPRTPGRNSRKYVDRDPAHLRPGVTPKSARPGNGIKANSSFHAVVNELVPTRNRRTVWTVATSPFAEAHFATFPPKLIEPCVLAGTRPGDVVLDPFMGAGTVGVVARRHSRHYLGIELNSVYIAMAERRIADEVQPVMWTAMGVAV